MEDMNVFAVIASVLFAAFFLGLVVRILCLRSQLSGYTKGLHDGGDAMVKLLVREGALSPRYLAIMSKPENHNV